VIRQVLGLGYTNFLVNAGLSGVILVLDARGKLDNADIEQSGLVHRRGRNLQFGLVGDDDLIYSTACAQQAQYDK
jgi:hypothetical protein